MLSGPEKRLMRERLAQSVVILHQASLTKQMALFWTTLQADQGAPMTLLQHFERQPAFLQSRVLIVNRSEGQRRFGVNQRLLLRCFFRIGHKPRTCLSVARKRRDAVALIGKS